MHFMGRRDRRAHIRVLPEDGHPIQVVVKSEMLLDTLWASDISEGGIGIFDTPAYRSCDADARVDLTISLPRPVNREIVVEGNVRHISSRKFGVRFTSLPSASRHGIRKYIAYRLRRSESLLVWLQFLLRMT